MLLKYPLTDSQYQRFQHANNDDQIQALGRQAGVEITDEKVVGGVETMYFKGRCSGTMALVPCDAQRNNIGDDGLFMWDPHHWECWIRIEKKPWWVPWFALDYGFRQALV